MNVLMLSEYPYDESEQGLGGIIQSTFQLLEGFKSIEDDFTINLCTLTNKKSKVITLNNKIKIHYIQNFKIMGFFYFYLYLIKTIFKEKINLIHGQGTVTYIILSLFLFKKSVQTIHGIYRNELNLNFHDNVKFFLKFKFKIFLESLYIKKIKNLISITSEVEKFVSSSNKNLNSYHINNPVDINFFNHSKFRKNCFNLLFVAAITPRKGLDLLIKAFVELVKIDNSFNLTVIGTWDWAPDYVESQKKYLKDAKIDKNVKFTGSIGRNELLNYFYSSDILILPSYAESAPMVISQALCNGNLVIATKVGGIPEMICHSTNGVLINPGSSEEIFEAVKHFYYNPDDIINITRNAIIRSKMKYHPNSIAKKTIDFYKSI